MITKQRAHGTTSRYRNGCRCAKCRKVWNAYSEKHRRRRKRLGQCYDCTGKPKKGHLRCPRHEKAIAKRKRLARKILTGDI